MVNPDLRTGVAPGRERPGSRGEHWWRSTSAKVLFFCSSRFRAGAESL